MKIDLKEIPKKEDMAQPVEPKPEPFYPTLYIDKELPLSEEDIGKTFEAKVTLKLTSRTESKRNKEKVGFSYSLDILDIEFDSKLDSAKKRHPNRKELWPKE